MHIKGGVDHDNIGDNKKMMGDVDTVTNFGNNFMVSAKVHSLGVSRMWQVSS